MRVAIDGITASGKSALGGEIADAVRARGRPAVWLSTTSGPSPAICRSPWHPPQPGFALMLTLVRRGLLDPPLGARPSASTAKGEPATSVVTFATTNRADGSEFVQIAGADRWLPLHSESLRADVADRAQGEPAWAILAHRGRRNVVFAGSSEAGKVIAHAATHDVQKVKLEPGRNLPRQLCWQMLMWSRYPGAADAIFSNPSQVWVSGSRLFIRSNAYDNVLDGVADKARAIRIRSLARE
jgi:hypothetical protein